MGEPTIPTPGEEGLKTYLAEQMNNLAPEAVGLIEACQNWAMQEEHVAEWVDKAFDVPGVREWREGLDPLTAHMSMMTAAAIIEGVQLGATLLARNLSKSEGIAEAAVKAPTTIMATYVAATGPLFERFVAEVMAMRNETRQISEGADAMLADLDKENPNNE